MTGHRLLPGPDARLRIAPWRGDPATAHVAPVRGRPTVRNVVRALDDLRAEGFTRVLTAASADQQPFLDAGFEVHERLHLLRRRLDDLPEVPPPPGRLRRGRGADRAAVLTVDRLAFPPFWQLDEPALDDALAATPSARLRVAEGAGGQVVGYAITGRAGPRGYLQRLAVAPTEQGAGIGGALVVDGLRWVRRWGAREVLVNTQEANEAAVRLYLRLGFQLEPEGLAVLHRAVDGAP